MNVILRCEVFGNFVPVDDVPECFDVGGALVLVVKIIGMFPDIEAEDGRAAAAAEVGAHERVVLVGGGADGEGAIGFFAEPCPAGTETGRAGFGEGFFEGIEGAEGFVDGSGEFTRWCFGAAGSDDLPEKAVIHMTAAVVTNRTADVFWNGTKVGNELKSRFRFKVGFSSDRRIEVGDISLMMSAVMDFHRESINVRLKRVQCIAKFR